MLSGVGSHLITRQSHPFLSERRPLRVQRTDTTPPSQPCKFNNLGTSFVYAYGVEAGVLFTLNPTPNLNLEPDHRPREGIW